MLHKLLFNVTRVHFRLGLYVLQISVLYFSNKTLFYDFISLTCQFHLFSHGTVSIFFLEGCYTVDMSVCSIIAPERIKQFYVLKVNYVAVS